MSEDKCPHCGHVNPPSNAHWQPTEMTRIIPVGAPYQRIVGALPVGGIIPRIESVDMKIISDQDYRYERMWVRRWAESEWRNDERR